jgi:hypothetical protein
MGGGAGLLGGLFLGSALGGGDDGGGDYGGEEDEEAYWQCDGCVGLCGGTAGMLASNNRFDNICCKRHCTCKSICPLRIGSALQQPQDT